MNLGLKGTDIITGFTGIITGYVVYLTGCNQYLLLPKCKKGNENSKPEGEWIDDSRVMIEEGTEVKMLDTSSTGFDISPHC